MTGSPGVTRFNAVIPVIVIPVITPAVGLLRRCGLAVRRGWSETEFRGLLYLVLVVIGFIERVARCAADDQAVQRRRRKKNVGD
jgi:hypothetical protein